MSGALYKCSLLNCLAMWNKPSYNKGKSAEDEDNESRTSQGRETVKANGEISLVQSKRQCVVDEAPGQVWHRDQRKEIQRDPTSSPYVRAAPRPPCAADIQDVEKEVDPCTVRLPVGSTASHDAASIDGLRLTDGHRHAQSLETIVGSRGHGAHRTHAVRNRRLTVDHRVE